MYVDLNVPVRPPPWFTSGSAPVATSGSGSGPSVANHHHQQQGLSKKERKRLQAEQRQSAFAGASAPSTAAEDAPADPMSWLDAGEKEALRARVLDAIELGYSTIALSFTVLSRFETSKHVNPFWSSSRLPPTASVKEPVVPFPELDPRCAAFRERKRKGKGNAAPRGVVQLTRMHLMLDEATVDQRKGGHGLIATNSAALATYDVLAAQPSSESTLSLALTSLTELKAHSVDVVSLDLASSPRLPFYLRRSALNGALQNGIAIEVNYAAMTTGGSSGSSSSQPTSDSGGNKAAKRNLVANTRELMRVLGSGAGGSGAKLVASAGGGGRTAGALVLSSGVGAGRNERLGARAPEDVVCLAALLSLPARLARDALSANARAIISRAQTRDTHRGVVSGGRIVEGPSAASQVKQLGDDMSGGQENGTATKRKRKAEEVEQDEGEGADGDGALLAQTSTTEGKKMRRLGTEA